MVLKRHPVETSGRKIRWYSRWQMLGTFLLLGLLPFLARSRSVCFTWYRRPPAEPPG